MATVFLNIGCRSGLPLCSTPIKRLRESAEMDTLGKHKLVDEPANADLILFAERITEVSSHLEQV